MNNESKAILLHDIRAAMVNHSGLQHEVQVSLRHLSELLSSVTAETGAQAGADDAVGNTPVREKINEIFEEDIDQCLPMLQVSSEKLTTLLNRYVSGDEIDLPCCESSL